MMKPETIIEIDETEEVVIEASENEENAAVTTTCDDLDIDSDDLDIYRKKVVVQKVNNVVVVPATTKIENCSYSELYQEFVESLSRFIFSKGHLKRNKSKVETSFISSTNLGTTPTCTSCQLNSLYCLAKLWEIR